MKKQDAEKLVCPFIMDGKMPMNRCLCMTDKCMAWQNIKVKKKKNQFGFEIDETYKEKSNKPEQHGYCKRLKS